ncbi:MAG: acyl-ACP--UDP-N-acetylglucosamine O-acyltransferase [Betaproteobacteria bacterium]|nr:MAG: acyl-ACP--UDP-N-acetylglucosamine O-acyltransferase [Betaproteobacteria bacterium]
MIHKTAIIDAKARIGANVRIGAFSLIGPDVEIGDDCEIAHHCVIEGHTTLGRGNRIFAFNALGGEPQDKKYAGEPTRLEIGDRNIVREYCTFNTGTVQDGGVTRIGDDNWIMAYVHVAHDCQLGHHIVMANNATLAGHVHIGDHAILGGFVGIHQFCHIGAHCILGIASVIRQDVPPYLTVAGNPAAPHGINSEGLKRRGFSVEAIAAIKRAYKVVYRNGLSLAEAQAALAEMVASTPEIAPFLAFIAQSERGILR